MGVEALDIKDPPREQTDVDVRNRRDAAWPSGNGPWRRVFCSLMAVVVRSVELKLEKIFGLAFC